LWRRSAHSLEYYYEISKRGQCEIWTSTVSYVEVFYLATEVRPFDDGGLDQIKEAFEQPFIKLIRLDMEVARKARGLRRSHGSLHPADAIHLASEGITPLHTSDDSHLLPFDGNLSCKDGQKLRVCKLEIPPSPPGTLPLTF
jgi:hypothetical protein